MGSSYISYVEEKLSGLYQRRPNETLCRVVSAGLRHMPKEASLKVLCAEVAKETGKQETAVYKALERAARGLLEQGNRGKLEALMGYRLIGEEPSLKELVTELIRALWHQRIQVEYRLLEGGLDGKAGICGRETCLSTGRERFMVMVPFSRNWEAVREVTRRWNREQKPLDEFREMILLDQLRED